MKPGMFVMRKSLLPVLALAAISGASTAMAAESGPQLDRSVATLTQAGQGFTGSSGQGNMALIEQYGALQQSQIVQSGIGNEATASVVGVWNQTRQVQSGNFNNSMIDVKGAGFAIVNLQSGDGNSFTATARGLGQGVGTPVVVEQSGGMSLTIDNLGKR